MNDTTNKLIDLCGRLRDVVVPSLGLHAARDHAGAAVGGDVTFGIDEDAEALLETYMAEHAPEWAYYSEDRGLQSPPDAELILVVDPIDGTRPAAAGFEMACVSVAAVPPSPSPDDGRRGRRRGAGDQDRRSVRGGEGRRLQHDAGDRRADPVAAHAHAPIWRACSGRSASAAARPSSSRESWRSSSMSPRVGGAVFDIGSATYSITRVLTGQLDAYVDIGPAIIEAHPAVEAEFRRVGRGNVLCNSPYDLAAVHLLCAEAGVPIGDAAGRPLDDKPVLGSGLDYQLACIASGQRRAAGRLVDVVQRGIGGLTP